MWTIEYSPEVRNFLLDSGELVTELIASIRSLRFTEGLPDIGAMETEPGLYYWLTEDHIVIYRRIEAEQRCRTISIKPDSY